MAGANDNQSSPPGFLVARAGLALGHVQRECVGRGAFRFPGDRNVCKIIIGYIVGGCALVLLSYTARAREREIEQGGRGGLSKKEGRRMRASAEKQKQRQRELGKCCWSVGYQPKTLSEG